MRKTGPSHREPGFPLRVGYRVLPYTRPNRRNAHSRPTPSEMIIAAPAGLAGNGMTGTGGRVGVSVGVGVGVSVGVGLGVLVSVGVGVFVGVLVLVGVGVLVAVSVTVGVGVL